MEYIVLTAHVEPADEDETGFVVFCPELDISSQGETVEESLRAIEEASTIFVETLSSTGDLIQFLKDRGVPIEKEATAHAVRIELDPNAREVASAFLVRIPAVSVS